MKTQVLKSFELESKHLPVTEKWDPLLVPSTGDDNLESPKILLVDDDPMFCAAVRKKAKKMHLDLTICKTLEDITKLSTKPEFDVAILDYFFGDSLTAFQITHLFSHELPVVLISNTEGGNLTNERWPPEVRSFIHKSVGTDAILAEALLAARWEHLVPESLKVETFVEPPWWLPIAAALTAAGALTLLYFFGGAGYRPTFSNWDRVRLQSSSLYSHELPGPITYV